MCYKSLPVYANTPKSLKCYALRVVTSLEMAL